MKTWVSRRDYWKPAYSEALDYRPAWPAVTERPPRASSATFYDPFVERSSTALEHTWMWKSGERQSLFRADYVLVDINNAVFTTRESIVDYQILDTISSGASDHNAVFASLAV